MSIKVILQGYLDKTSTPDLLSFQQWVNTVFQHINPRLPQHITEVCIRIVDKKESLELNQNFRHQSKPTNVLSFPTLTNTAEIDANEISLGDIAICAEIVNEEAHRYHISVKNHWAHLTIHSILHLLGYDHIKKEEAQQMESLEISMLASLGIDNPYDESLE